MWQKNELISKALHLPGLIISLANPERYLEFKNNVLFIDFIVHSTIVSSMLGKASCNREINEIGWFRYTGNQSPPTSTTTQPPPSLSPPDGLPAMASKDQHLNTEPFQKQRVAIQEDVVLNLIPVSYHKWPRSKALQSKPAR